LAKAAGCEEPDPLACSGVEGRAGVEDRVDRPATWDGSKATRALTPDPKGVIGIDMTELLTRPGPWRTVEESTAPEVARQIVERLTGRRLPRTALDPGCVP